MSRRVTYVTAGVVALAWACPLVAQDTYKEVLSDVIAKWNHRSSVTKAFDVAVVGPITRKGPNPAPKLKTKDKLIDVSPLTVPETVSYEMPIRFIADDIGRVRLEYEDMEWSIESQTFTRRQVVQATARTGITKALVPAINFGFVELTIADKKKVHPSRAYLL